MDLCASIAIPDEIGEDVEMSKLADLGQCKGRVTHTVIMQSAAPAESRSEARRGQNGGRCE